MTELSGKQIKTLMRKNKKTVRGLSQILGITMKRIRQVRTEGLTHPHSIRDWIQGITGKDPGPINPFSTL